MRLTTRDRGLIGLASLLLTLAFPPFHLVVPAFLCLVPAAWLILGGCKDEQPSRRHLHQGFWYGTITHAVLLYWLATALWQYGRGAIALYVVASVMFGGAYAVVFVVAGRIARGSAARLVLALPAGVVFLEWLAAEVGPIAFPWHQLALTVAATPALVQAADLGGAGGLGFVLVMINTSLALAWWTRRDRVSWLRHVESAAMLLFVVVLYGLHRLHTLPLITGAEVVVVQPNVTVDEKWVPSREDAIVERTARLTERALAEQGAAFVAWPETALPDVIQGHPAWIMRLARLTHVTGSTVLAGGVDVDAGVGEARRSYNAAFAFSPGEGAGAGAVYRKQRLIPMVERAVSGALDLSRTGSGGFTPGRSTGIADSSIGRYGVLLCYELTFAGLAREARRAGASVLVTLSNDAWFGRTSAPHQHFAHATLRAVENRVPVVRAANTGVSGIVDPLGRVVTSTEPFVETYTVGRIYRSGTVPPAVHFGGYVGPVALGLLLALLAASMIGDNRPHERTRMARRG